jgi:hypothetical protein
MCCLFGLRITHITFETLKSALVPFPILSLPDFNRPFLLETDVSDIGVGVVLMQGGHPIDFVRKPLGPKLRGLSTYEKEYIVILMAAEKWRSYLQLGEFVIATDHKSLSHLFEQRLHTPWQQKVFPKLLALNYRIVYKKGVDNKAADALSRRSYADSAGQTNLVCDNHSVDSISHRAACLAVSTCKPQWLLDIVASYDHDVVSRDMIAKLAVHDDVVPNFSLN